MENYREQLSSKNMEEVKKALEQATTIPALQELVDLYASIWKMTYANAEGYAGMELAEQIVLMNEQEDLVPNPPVPIESVTHLDLGGFPEAVFFPELLRYKNIRRLDFWENSLEAIPPELAELVTLETLYFGDAIRELPEFLLHLPALREIRLDNDSQLDLSPALAARFSEKGIRLIV